MSDNDDDEDRYQQDDADMSDDDREDWIQRIHVDEVSPKPAGKDPDQPDAKRLKVQPAVQPALEPWACATCTFDNEALYLTCACCTSERPSGPAKTLASVLDLKVAAAVSPPAAPGGQGGGRGWTCTVCTMFHAMSSDTKCSICDTRRPEKKAMDVEEERKSPEEVAVAVESPLWLEILSVMREGTVAVAPIVTTTTTTLDEEEKKTQGDGDDAMVVVVTDKENAPVVHIPVDDDGVATRAATLEEETIMALPTYQRAIEVAVGKVLPAFDAALQRSALLVAADMAVWRRCLLRLTVRRAIQAHAEALEKQRKLDEAECVLCQRIARDTAVQRVQGCEHTVCLTCSRAYMLKLISAPDAVVASVPCPSPGCTATKDVGTGFVQHCLSAREFGLYSEATFRATIQGTNTPNGSVIGMTFLKCPNTKCNLIFEHVPLDKNSPEWRQRSAREITETDADGKVLSPEAWKHHEEYRVRCHGCQGNFCTGCKVAPYHLGRTCAQQLSFGEGHNCRWCSEQLTLANTDKAAEAAGVLSCTSAECRPLFAGCCKTKLACGHQCYGTSEDDEAKIHPPCLHDDCVAKNPDSAKACASDLCPVCWVGELGTAPVVQLGTCGHFVHADCVATKIEKRWPSVRITFGFLDCATCKMRMTSESFPTSKRIRDLLVPIEKLHADISARAVARLQIESLDKDIKLTDPTSPYYNKPLEFALASFAFYQCWKFLQHKGPGAPKCCGYYFGGLRGCAQNADTESRPPSEFICFQCSDLTAMIKCKDPAHADFALWKCRYVKK